MQESNQNKVNILPVDPTSLISIRQGETKLGDVLKYLTLDSIEKADIDFFIITFFGEIIPQAYFSRHALRMASMLAPVLRFYQFALYPVAKPTSLLLDAWLGKESVQFFGEQNIHPITFRCNGWDDRNTYHFP